MWDLVYYNLKEEKENEDYNRRVTFSFLVALIFLILFMLVIRNFFLSTVEVIGPSMQDTVYETDILLVNRVDELDYGKVVVFEDSVIKEKFYIKRLIAFGGDTVWSVDGDVFRQKKGSSDIEKLVEPYVTSKTYVGYKIVDIPKTVVPEGTCYVMGDNRVNSTDSRTALGFIEYSRIVGTVPQWVIDNKDNVLGFFYKFL